MLKQRPFRTSGNDNSSRGSHFSDLKSVNKHILRSPGTNIAEQRKSALLLTPFCSTPATSSLPLFGPACPPAGPPGASLLPSCRPLLGAQLHRERCSPTCPKGHRLQNCSRLCQTANECICAPPYACFCMEIPHRAASLSSL